MPHALQRSERGRSDGLSRLTIIASAAVLFATPQATHAADAVALRIPGNRVSVDANATSGMVWHPSGKLVAFGVSRSRNAGAADKTAAVVVADIERGERVVSLVDARVERAFERVAWDATGATVIACGFAKDGPLVVAWDAVTGAVKWSHDNEMLVGAGADGLVVTRVQQKDSLVVREGTSGDEVAVITQVPRPALDVFPEEGRASCVAVDRDTLRVFNYSEKTIFAWTLSNGRAAPGITIAGHRDSSPPQIAVMNPSGTTLVTGGADNTVRVWDTKTGEERVILRGHRERIKRVACSPDGDAIESRSEDSLRTWRASTRSQVACFDKENAAAGLNGIGYQPDSVSPNARHVGVVSKGVVRILEFDTLREPGVFWAPNGAKKPFFLSWRHDGEAIGGFSREVDGQTGICGWNVSTGAGEPPVRVTSLVIDVACSPFANQMLVMFEKQVDSDLDSVRSAAVVDPASGRGTPVSLAMPFRWQPQGGSIGWIGATRNGEGTGDRFLVMTDVVTGRATRRKLAVPGSDKRWTGLNLEGIALNQDCTRVATWPHMSERSADGICILIWDAATGDLLHTLAAPEHREFHGVALSADGRLVAAGCDMRQIDGSFRESLRIWDVRSGKACELPEATGETYAAAFSPDGRTLVTGEYADPCGRVRVWSVDGAAIRLKGGLGTVISNLTFSSLAFSSDGHYLACMVDQVIEVWNMKAAASKD